MKKFKYQMHAHTLPCSACSKMTPEELINALYKDGYSGCVITNHFMGGNTGINRKLPWNEFVRQYELDFFELKKYAEKYDIDIIFGVEEHVGGGLEILCYGLTPEILYKHSELANRDIETWYKVMNLNGVICLQAHPFRERDYIPEPMLLPTQFIDGIEVWNEDNSDENDYLAECAAKEHPEWILSSGADTHKPETVCFGGIKTAERIKNGKELVRILRSGKYKLIK